MYHKDTKNRPRFGLATSPCFSTCSLAESTCWTARSSEKVETYCLFRRPRSPEYTTGSSHYLVILPERSGSFWTVYSGDFYCGQLTRVPTSELGASEPRRLHGHLARFPANAAASRPTLGLPGNSPAFPAALRPSCSASRELRASGILGVL